MTVTVRSSKLASRIGDYWNAVDDYLRTGNADKLKEFEGKSIRVGKSRLYFVTDLPTLDRIASAGEVSFEDIMQLRRKCAREGSRIGYRKQIANGGPKSATLARLGRQRLMRVVRRR
jgi:hypothetical protein